MIAIIAIIFTFAMVFGSYIMSGGHIEIILEAAPHEFMAIGGASLGAFFLSNPLSTGKKTLKDFKKVLSGPAYSRTDYNDLLCLMFEFTKLMKMKGLLAIESHIENYHESEIFQKYPSVMHNHHAAVMICDTLRLLTMSFSDPYQVQDVLQNLLDKHHHDETSPARALQTTADGLPAIGIVAAVLGVIKTMASINQPTTVLGAMIGGALVGTFLGVFLAYLLVSPIASKLAFCYDEEATYFNIIRDIIVAHLHGNAPQVSVEIGRGNIPSHLQPTFLELEESLNAKTASGAAAAPAA
jgi:chemotaxis protein MotA